MLFACVHALVRLLLEVLVIRSRSDAERDLELLALRHEVATLQRQVKRPELLPADRLLLAALGRRELEVLKVPIKVLIHDRDSRYSSDFDAVFSAAGIRIARTPFRSPRANAACERVLGSLLRECLDWLIILGERHLLQVLREYLDHYNRARPHRALNVRPPEPQPIPDGGEIVRRQRLHSLINECSRAA